MEDHSKWFRYSLRFQGKDENKLETSYFSCFLRRWEYGFVWKGGIRGIYNCKWYSANWETNSQQKPANKCNYKSFLLLIAASVQSVEKRNQLEKGVQQFLLAFFPNYFRKIAGHWRGKTYTGHMEQMHCFGRLPFAKKCLPLGTGHKIYICPRKHIGEPMRHLFRVENIDRRVSDSPLQTKMWNFAPKIWIFGAKSQFFILEPWFLSTGHITNIPGATTSLLGPPQKILGF